MQTTELSAKIYQFAPRPRLSPAGRALFAQRASEAPVVDYECGWYHDEAIAEEAAERATAADAARKVRPLFPN